MKSVREYITPHVIDQYNYRGRGDPQLAPIVTYGGQLIGQAVTAAFNSIQDLDSAFQLHSVHCYFVNPTQYDRDIFYKVQRIKEGKSFCSLTVEASQGNGDGDGRVTFKCMISFDKPEPPGATSVLDFTTKHIMPIVRHPERPSATVDSDRQCLIHFEKLTYGIHRFSHLDMYMCLTKMEYENYKARRPGEPRHFIWIKPKSLGYTALDHQNYHRAVLAFLSDLFLAAVIRSAHPTVKLSKGTSLDHSIWFHTDCNSQDWHLFVIECDHCRGGRALNSSRIYRKDGTLVASCSQESLLRPKL